MTNSPELMVNNDETMGLTAYTRFTFRKITNYSFDLWYVSSEKTLYKAEELLHIEEFAYVNRLNSCFINSAQFIEINLIWSAINKL